MRDSTFASWPSRPATIEQQAAGVKTGDADHRALAAAQPLRDRRRVERAGHGNTRRPGDRQRELRYQTRNRRAAAARSAGAAQTAREGRCVRAAAQMLRGALQLGLGGARVGAQRIVLGVRELSSVSKPAITRPTEPKRHLARPEGSMKPRCSRPGAHADAGAGLGGRRGGWRRAMGRRQWASIGLSIRPQVAKPRSAAPGRRRSAFHLPRCSRWGQSVARQAAAQTRQSYFAMYLRARVVGRARRRPRPLRPRLPTSAPPDSIFFASANRTSFSCDALGLVVLQLHRDEGVPRPSGRVMPGGLGRWPVLTTVA